MALILPELTRPPGVVIPRAHSPREAAWDGGYTEYRRCLRWDFAFTCPYCLRHESDIVPSGAEGWGVTTAEHVALQSKDHAAANRYDNVVPIPGTSSRQRLEENVAALDIELDDEDLEKIEEIAPRGAVAGTRYDPASLGLTNR